MRVTKNFMVGKKRQMRRHNILFLLTIFLMSYQVASYAAGDATPGENISDGQETKEHSASLSVVEPESFTFNYGSQGKVNFYKSTELIAIKKIPTTGSVSPISSTSLGPYASNFRDSKLNLLGFELFSYKDDIPLDAALESVQKHTIDDAIATNVFHSSPTDDTPFIPTGYIYLKFIEGAVPRECTKILEEYQLSIDMEEQDRLPGDSAFFVKVSSHGPRSFQGAVRIATELQNNPLVEIAEPDFVTRAKAAAYPPLNRLMKDQWHLSNIGQHRGITIGLLPGSDARVMKAWDIMNNLGKGLGSEEIKIAIIDDGFDLGHPCLGGRDPKKVLSPWDFSRSSYDVSPGPGDWHGTAVAGVAIGVDDDAGPDSAGCIGVAPRARLIPIRWNNGSLNDREVKKWFDYANDQGADIISCSWGPKARNYPLSTNHEKMLETIAMKGRKGLGVVIVFAAGNNDKNVNTPGSYVNGYAIHPNVIAVAASTSADLKSDYSNFGREISVCAPSSGTGGMSILTSDARKPNGYNDVGDYTYKFGGTSSSCPLVAGVAALILSVNPDLESKEVKNIIQISARKIGNLLTYDNEGRSDHYGYGCVNAEGAVNEALKVKEKKKAIPIVVTHAVDSIHEKSQDKVNEYKTQSGDKPKDPSMDVVLLTEDERAETIPIVVMHAVDSVQEENQDKVNGDKLKDPNGDVAPLTESERANGNGDVS